jgi:hypothetical protein
MKKITFIVLIVFLCPLVYGNQNYITDSSAIKKDSVKHRREWQLGLRLDINSVIETALLDPGYKPEYIKRFHTYSGYSLSPFGVYLPIRYNYREDIGFEIRPGLIMSGESLTSFELGLNCYSYPFYKNVYIVSGFELLKHTVFLSEPLDFHPYLPVKRSLFWNKLYISLSLGFGYQIGENTSVDFTIVKYLNEEYGNYIYDGLLVAKYQGSLTDGEYPVKLQWMMKLGLNFYGK